MGKPDYMKYDGRTTEPPYGKEAAPSSCTCELPCSVPAWVADEIKKTWRAARDAGGEMAAFRIIERMVDRLGYGRMKNNPSLVPNPRADRMANEKGEKE